MRHCLLELLSHLEAAWRPLQGLGPGALARPAGDTVAAPFPSMIIYGFDAPMLATPLPRLLCENGSAAAVPAQLAAGDCPM